MELIEFIDQAKLTKELDRATGEGLKVAIVDSGVDISHPALKGAVHSSYHVQKFNMSFSCNPIQYPTDEIGHGTMCAGVIHDIAPQAEIYSVKVFDGYKTSIGHIITAIDWCVKNKMDVVNLSLCSKKMSSQELADLHRVVENAYYKDVLLIAATDNHVRTGFPADFSSVIGVDFENKPDFKTFDFHTNRPYEIDARGIYVKVIKPGNREETVSCSSIATPHITGLACRLKSCIPSLNSHQLKTLLWALRSNTANED